MNIKIPESERKLYAGILFMTIAFTALLFPLIIFASMFIAGGIALVWYYLDEQKKKKAVA